MIKYVVYFTSDTRCIDWLSVITQYGNTALILASGQCGTEAVVELVKAGADVNLQNNVCWCCVWICGLTKGLSSFRMESLL